MELKTIEDLLKSYEEGLTTLQEEATLRAYFSQDEIPAHLKHYSIIFQYYKQAKAEDFTAPIPKTPRRISYKSLSIAASVVLLIGLFWKSFTPDFPQFTEDEMATYHNTRSALELLSFHLNKGQQSQMNALTTVSNAIRQGHNNLTLLHNFNTTTNTIFKLNP